MTELERRKMIIDKWLDDPQCPRHFIAKALKISRSTVDEVINRYSTTLSISRKSGSGGKRGSRKPQLDQKIASVILKNRNMSVRDIAAKCQTNATMVQRAKKRKGLKT